MQMLAMFPFPQITAQRLAAKRLNLFYGQAVDSCSAQTLRLTD